VSPQAKKKTKKEDSFNTKKDLIPTIFLFTLDFTDQNNSLNTTGSRK
jgi:hypothetical protein